MRVILVSDTHLSPAAPEAEANWDAVLRYVEANVPDVVIHLGDLTLDGAHNAGDLHYGRRQLDRLPVTATDTELAGSPAYGFLPQSARNDPYHS
jgi:3',5'-cyclic AMP phosphodiesterase CpdA